MSCMCRHAGTRPPSPAARLSHPFTPGEGLRRSNRGHGSGQLSSARHSTRNWDDRSSRGHGSGTMGRSGCRLSASTITTAVSSHCCASVTVRSCADDDTLYDIAPKFLPEGTSRLVPAAIGEVRPTDVVTLSLENVALHGGVVPTAAGARRRFHRAGSNAQRSPGRECHSRKV